MKLGELDMVRYKKIYSKRVFLKLVSNGHELMWIERNRNKKWLSVFVFRESNELLNDLSNISK